MEREIDVEVVLGQLRRWATQVISDATPDEHGEVGFTCDSEVQAARRFRGLDEHMQEYFSPVDWPQP